MTSAMAGAFSTTPDTGGDFLQITRREHGQAFALRVQNGDGDFHMTYMTREDALALARFIAEDGA